MKYYLLAFKKFATFSGRATRKEYWMFFLINFVIAAVLGAATRFGVLPESVGAPLAGLYNLIIIMPTLAVGTRRFHDVGKSGTWWFINLIPLVGFIWFFVLMATKDGEGENKYGIPSVE